MLKKSDMLGLKELNKLATRGAFATKSIDFIAHARDPTALSRDLGGLVGVGVAGAYSESMMDVAFPSRKRRRRRKL